MRALQGLHEALGVWQPDDGWLGKVCCWCQQRQQSRDPVGEVIPACLCDAGQALPSVPTVAAAWEHRDVNKALTHQAADGAQLSFG